jgi:formylglycine-generating enzyme required for sulfatase activity
MLTFADNAMRRICTNIPLLICLLGAFFITLASFEGRPQERPALKLEQFNKFVRDRSTTTEDILDIAREVGVGFDIDQQLEETIIQSRGQKSRGFLAELKLLRRKTVRLDSMARIPKGTLQMGSEEQVDEMPVLQVAISSYFLDKHEVTNAEYDKFLEYVTSTGDHSKCHPTESPGKNHAPAFSKDNSFKGAEQPVIGVDWYDAYAYAAWAGVRLPTEAEWEWAARGGLVGQRFPWGAASPDGKACYGGSTQGPKSVGLFSPNGFGLSDMAGNVWEWVDDWYRPGYRRPDAKTTPETAAQISRVIRGGSWASSEDNLRCAFRGNFSPTFRRNSIGFRCAVTK